MRSWPFLVGAVLAFAIAGAAQEIDISELADGAGIIFRGTVVGTVVEPARAPGEMAVARVTFRVDDGIRGAITGQTLTVRQWNAAADEYRVGEALVLFLYAPSEMSGLTSPVGGSAGHRRVEEIPADVLESLRRPPQAATGSLAPANAPQRPARPKRGGAE